MARPASGNHPSLARCLGALAAAALTSVGAAQPDATPTDDLGSLLDRLGSADLAQREAAASRLGASAAALTGALGTTIDPETLSPEQRSRVSAVLREQFAKTPRAGLGISFRAVIDQGDSSGVRVEVVVPDFPVAGFLKPGDLIVAADGTPLVGTIGVQSDTNLRYAILSRDPGETVALRIRRGDDEIDLDIPTGSFSNLKDTVPPGGRLLEGAWRWRAQRLGLVDSAVTALPDDQTTPWTSSYRRRSDIPQVMPAGQARASRGAERAVPTLGSSAAASRRAMTKRHLAIVAQLDNIDAQVNETQQRLADTRAQAERDRGNPKRTARLTAEIRALETKLRAIERQRKEMHAILSDLVLPPGG